jgi:short-subunit dehydrogenase
MSSSFHAKYGKVAVVAGASEGLGAAFGEALAARGLDLVLLARRAGALDELAAALTKTHRVKVMTVVADLADAAFVDKLVEVTQDLEVGLAVYNAGASFRGPFLDRPLADALRVVEVNIQGPLRFVHALVPAMRARGKGGVVLMSSMAGFQGAPLLATYAASKAFNIVFGESLWGELRADGVDVITACAGAIRTASYAKAAAVEAPGMLDPKVVAELALDSLGHGPTAILGGVNKLALFLLRRLMSRRGAVAMMQKNIAKTVGTPGGG